MTEIQEMNTEDFTIKGKDMPFTVWDIYKLHDCDELVVVKFDTDDEGKVNIIGAWLDDAELGLSFPDRDELIAMMEVYRDNQRQDAAENGI